MINSALKESRLTRLKKSKEEKEPFSGISQPAELSKPWRPGWLSEEGATGEKAAPAEPAAKPEEPKPVPRRSKLVEVAPGILAAPGSIWTKDWATVSYAEFRAAVASQGTRSEAKSKAEVDDKAKHPRLRGFDE